PRPTILKSKPTAFSRRAWVKLSWLPSVLPRSWRGRRLPGPVRSMARNLLGAVLGQQTTAVVTLADPLDGYRMRINLRMQKAYMYGSFEPEVVQFIVGIVQQGWNCFDVGANIGYLTLLLHRRAPGGTVYAFEPLPSAFATL